MESELSDERRADVWEGLSEAFVDNEVDYVALRRGVEGVPLDELRRIFFTEVAPHCGANLLAPAPPIWIGFDRGLLTQDIRAMLARARSSAWGRFRHRMAVALCHWNFAPLWRQVEAELSRSPDTENALDGRKDRA